MKKSLFFKFFLFAVIGTMVTFTSCKDYDDDIDHLQDQITSLKGVSSEIETIKSNIAAAQTAASDAVTKANEALEKAKEALAAAESSGDSSAVEAAQAAADKAQEDADKAQAKADEVEKEAERLEGLIEALESRVAALESSDESASQDDLKALDAEVKELQELVAEMGVLELNNLVLIPDYVSADGALPKLVFSELETPCEFSISPEVVARYQVSPRNATIDMIKSVYFESNTPTVRAAGEKVELDPKAVEYTLEDGVLEVKVALNTEAVIDTELKITQLMLFVETTSGNTVNSDWVKVEADEVGDLALVRVPGDVNEDTAWEDLVLTTTLEATKGLSVTDSTEQGDPRVVDLAYDETLDLLTVVNTMLQDEWKDFDINTYGLKYEFDLNDEEGEKIVYEIGSNKTDQQKFLNLVGSEVSTRVYDIDGSNPASKDRTPIVHVTLMTEDCKVLEGFIKINIVEKKVEDIIEPVIIDAGEFEARCGVWNHIVGTQQMNEEFYAKAGVSKTFFHTNYTFVPGEDGVGVVEEIENDDETESFNLEWRIGERLQFENIGKEVTHSGTYTYGGHVINVEFTATVVGPTADISNILLTNYWDTDLTYITHNVAVPELYDNNPVNATFDNNINNAFKSTGRLLDLEAANEDYADYSYEYFFKNVQPIKTVDGITISVSEDGKDLIATKGEEEPQIVATIEEQGEDGDVLAYKENSELGKHLLNKGPEFMKATLYMVVKNSCEKDVELTGKFDGEFDVHFLRPVNLEGESNDKFIDAVDFGAEGSFINTLDVVRLSDWRNYAKSSEDYYFSPDHMNYYEFYDVQEISINTENIVPKGLITSGGIELEELPETMDVEFVEDTSVDEDGNKLFPYGKLTYKNNGAGLVNEFILQVPVTVSYKWGEVETTVDVVVRPTAATESIR